MHEEREREGEGEGGVWRNLRGGRGKADYRGMVQSSQPYVAPCVNGVECGLGMRGLRMVAAFWGGILVELTQYTVGRHSPTL